MRACSKHKTRGREFDFRARLFATQGAISEAAQLYSSAVDGCWWFVGANQKPILEEALLYAVGVGDQVAAKRYWDKTFLLGLNKLPKRDLDKQERRRLTYGFERLFYPQQAKDRVLLGIEMIDKEFELDAKALKAPNRKMEFADTRTRRIVFMDTMMRGTLADVQRMLQAGADVNAVIRESGEGSLTFALRRANDRRDPAILHEILRQPFTKDTVNRPAGTARETPLQIANEMADPAVAQRLIDLGADLESECGWMPSALCHAVNLLARRTQPNSFAADTERWINENCRATAHDAKFGAVLDSDIADHRKQSVDSMMSSPRHRAICKGVAKRFAQSPEAYIAVIHVLLTNKADSNRRYKVDRDPRHEWTPTLIAAQVGPLGLFKLLIDCGGDATLALMKGSQLERFDAMWIAVAHDRGSIVRYLSTRLKA